MGKALIIAEKPSVAGDISKALGKFQKHDDYYENDEYVISSAVGQPDRMNSSKPAAWYSAIRSATWS